MNAIEGNCFFYFCNVAKTCSYGINISRNLEIKYLFFISKHSLPRLSDFRSSPPEMFLGKGVLKICSKFTGEHPCRSVISIVVSHFHMGALL